MNDRRSRLPLCVLLATLLLVAACQTDRLLNNGTARSALPRATWVNPPQPCVIGLPQPQPPPDGNTYFGTQVPTSYQTCGVSWSINWVAPVCPQCTADGIWWVEDPTPLPGVIDAVFMLGLLGSYQGGPMTVTFNRSVMNFTLLLRAGDTTGISAGHYMEAYDSANTLLGRVDFTALPGLGSTSQSTLPMARIRKVLVYPMYFQPLFKVERVAHQIAFAVDTTPPAASVKVSCTPSPVVRGSNITCKTSLSPARPFTVVRRKATGTGFNVTDTTRIAVASGDSNSWIGPAVASSDVTSTVEVLQNGVPITISNSQPASFVVQKRSWAIWKITKVNEAITFAGRMVPYPGINYPMGVQQVDFPVGDSVTTPVTRPTAGPNKGLGYLKTAPVVNTSLIGIHPALVKPGTRGRTAHPLSDRWYNDQNGLGSGTCKAADVGRLLSNVRRHEGVGIKPNSHPGIANQQFALLRPDTLLEKSYTPLPDAELHRQVNTTMRVFTDSLGPYKTAQRNFDQQDTYITNTQGINCVFDYQLSDQ